MWCNGCGGGGDPLVYLQDFVGVRRTKQKHNVCAVLFICFRTRLLSPFAFALLRKNVIVLYVLLEWNCKELQ